MDLVRFSWILRSLSNAIKVTTNIDAALKLQFSSMPGFGGDLSVASLCWVATDALLHSPSSSSSSSSHSTVDTARIDRVIDAIASDQTAVAFLQFTSGSTSAPRGAVITHRNLAHNMALIVSPAALNAGSDTVEVSWLPQYHDMGLVGAYLACIYCGGSGYYMSPVDFIKDPLLWLAAISTYKATHVQAPNFAYALAVKKYLLAQKRLGSRYIKDLDLSSVRHM
jgi:acyl-CoA synthetase (AMP-forming)/AMP-acid ligase II